MGVYGGVSSVNLCWGFSLCARKQTSLAPSTVQLAVSTLSLCPQASDPDTGEGGCVTYSLLPGTG